MTRARRLWVWAAVLAVSCGSAHAMTYPYVVESRSGGQNNGFYSETGTWLDSTGHSTASGLTPGIGSRFSTAVGSTAQFKLNDDFTDEGLLATQLFEVFVTWPTTSNTSSPTKFTVTSDEPLATIYLDQNSVGGDVWYSLGTYTFTENTDYFVTIEAYANDQYADARADAVKWQPVPEPASMAFMAIGGMALLRRRRRA